MAKKPVKPKNASINLEPGLEILDNFTPTKNTQLNAVITRLGLANLPVGKGLGISVSHSAFKSTISITRNLNRKYKNCFYSHHIIRNDQGKVVQHVIFRVK